MLYQKPICGISPMPIALINSAEMGILQAERSLYNKKDTAAILHGE